MKVLPVSELKKPSRRTHCAYPKPGSKRNIVYQRLFENRGRPVFMLDILGSRPSRSRLVSDLRDYYGCDIRACGHNGYYILAGEWFGSEYVDYVDQAINAALASGEAA